MNALHNILLAVTLFIVTFSIASSFVYPTTKNSVPTKTISQVFMLTEGIYEPIIFTPTEIPVPEPITTSDNIEQRTTQLIEEPLVQFPISVIEPVEIPLPTQLIENPTVEVPDNLQDVVGVATQGVTIINNLNKRQSLKLLSPLGIKRKVNKVEKNLATTKAEILTLYKENPTVVTAILKTHLLELFV